MSLAFTLGYPDFRGNLTGIFSGRIQVLMFLVPIASFISVLNLKIGTVRTTPLSMI